MSDASQLLSEAARRIPPLSAGSHKGQARRLCVVGAVASTPALPILPPLPLCALAPIWRT
uniref:Uncharacterized protein n=1 Tax=Macrostomum lignano TaxID=282301 RepID=A0A1I8HWS6_9PLAT